MRLLPVILESQSDMSVVDGATIERRIRINQPDDENTRCRVSRALHPPKDFSHFMQQPTTLSTSNVISFLQGRTEPSGPRRCRRGARQLRSLENVRGAEFSCSSFNNVTMPLRGPPSQGSAHHAKVRLPRPVCSKARRAIGSMLRDDIASGVSYLEVLHEVHKVMAAVLVLRDECKRAGWARLQPITYCRA